MVKNCICLICFEPNDMWIKFLSKFNSYDIYICVDDNNIDYKEKYIHYMNIHIIQIKEEDCKNNGFIDTNFAIRKYISGWDKALYYFSKINTNYDNVWFLEDDVFFYNEETLLNIDSKYNDSDMLSNQYYENLLGENTDWLWPKIKIRIPPPYYCAMVCAVRMSKILLSKIKDYANEYMTLFFLEALFSTICKTNNLKYDIPSELWSIAYRRNYNDDELNKSNLYHPIKDMNKHTYYRNMLS